MRKIIAIQSENDAVAAAVRVVAESVARVMELEVMATERARLVDIGELVDEVDGALVIVGLEREGEVQGYLNAMRELRVPYMFCKGHQRSFEPKRLLLPVTNLMEDREKGPYASSFARHYGAVVKMIRPKDYGSMAGRNVDAIGRLLESVGVEYVVDEGRKDSSGVEREALRFSEDAGKELLVISASRDYGLDDIVFGPKERKIIRMAEMPVLVVNPRGDLYPLCD